MPRQWPVGIGHGAKFGGALLDLLGLDESWKVTDVNLELEATRVTTRLDFTGKRGCCGRTAKPAE